MNNLYRSFNRPAVKSKYKREKLCNFPHICIWWHVQGRRAWRGGRQVATFMDESDITWARNIAYEKVCGTRGTETKFMDWKCCKLRYFVTVPCQITQRACICAGGEGDLFYYKSPGVASRTHCVWSHPTQTQYWILHFAMHVRFRKAYLETQT